MQVGFIGQGWIGKHYADDFEARGLSVVRYSLEEPYVNNKAAIAECDIVFIAVPTPTRVNGFDGAILRSVLPLVGEGRIAVIKSTTLPGTTKELQKEFPQITILHSPEFLAEKTAAFDAAHPTRTLIGLPQKTPAHEAAAKQVLEVLPRAPYEAIVDSNESELVKYAANAFLMAKVVLANVVYDMAEALGADYEQIAKGIGSDPRIGPSHLQVVHASGHTEKTGRGAGGHCFIKDFAALRALCEQVNPDDAKALAFLRAVEGKNSELLRKSEKDLDLLEEVYGKEQ